MGREAKLNVCFGRTKFEVPLRFKWRCWVCSYIDIEKYWSKNVNRSWRNGRDCLRGE